MSNTTRHINVNPNGSKKDKGAFYGRKKDAKERSVTNRRHADQLIAQGIYEGYEDDE